MAMKVLDPTTDRAGEPVAMAPRLRSLAGTTVGLLDNGKVNAARFLDHVEDILVREHGVRAVVRRRKPNMSAPAPAELLAELTACDAVLAAVGD